MTERRARIEKVEKRRDEQEEYLFMILFFWHLVLFCLSFVTNFVFSILIGCDLYKDIIEDFFQGQSG